MNPEKMIKEAKTVAYMQVSIMFLSVVGGVIVTPYEYRWIVAWLMLFWSTLCLFGVLGVTALFVLRHDLSVGGS